MTLFQTLFGLESAQRKIAVVSARIDAEMLHVALENMFRREARFISSVEGNTTSLYCNGPEHVAEKAAFFAEGFIQGRLARKAER